MEKDLIEWVEKISLKRDELGGFSMCPFAKKALEDKKIFWSYIGYEVVPFISRYMEEMKEDYEVVVFYNTEKNLTDEDCHVIIKELNKQFPEIIFLKDHPDSPGFIQGLNTGNEKYPVILAQPKDKLNKARERLSKAGYYKHWDDEYRKEIWSYGYES